MLLEELLPALSVAVEEVTVPSRGWGRRMVCAGPHCTYGMDAHLRVMLSRHK